MTHMKALGKQRTLQTFVIECNIIKGERTRTLEMCLSKFLIETLMPQDGKRPFFICGL